LGKYIATWSPLTGEAELLNELMYDLGVERNVILEDVLDIDADLNDALALIIIYPESTDDERRKDVEEKQREHTESESVGVRCFIKQNIDNACGMIAIVNAVLNSSARIFIKDGSILDGIAQRRSIEVNDEIRSIYNKAVMEDDPGASVEHHFTVLIEVQVGESDKCLDTHLVELDGERLSPYIRASSKGSGLHDAALVRGILIH